MLVQTKDEERLDYLIRVLSEFMATTVAGEQTIEYDDTTCDGYCLAQDVADELSIDIQGE